MTYIVLLGVICVASAVTVRELEHQRHRGAYALMYRGERMHEGNLRPASPAEKQAAILSITKQLDAFRSDDYKSAARCQSSMLKRNFASLEAFRQTIKRQYPVFADYKSVSYGQAMADPTGQYLKVMVAVTGRNGVRNLAEYLMVLENKVYRVDGVMVETQPAKGAQPPPTVSV